MPCLHCFLVATDIMCACWHRTTSEHAQRRGQYEYCRLSLGKQSHRSRFVLGDMEAQGADWHQGFAFASALPMKDRPLMLQVCPLHSLC